MKTFSDTSILKRINAIKESKGKDCKEFNESWDEMNERITAEAQESDRIRFKKQLRDARMSKAIGRSGLQGKHLLCTFDNYVVTSEAQQDAVDFAKRYADTFGFNPHINFAFFGASRTGKNHLSAAICNQLIPQGISCLVITVTELNIKIKETYNNRSSVTEGQILKEICNFDFLVLDEIGISTESENIKVLLNYIIDQRSINEKATGILSNLDANGIRKELGDRAVNRLMEVGKSVKFTWDKHQFKFDDL